MAKIEFRPERLVRVVVGAGYRDPVSDQLVLMGKEVADAPDDAAAARLKPLTIELLDACSRTNRFLWQARDDFEDRWLRVGQIVKSQVQRAVALVPTSGHGSGADYQTAVQAATEKSTADAVNDVVIAVVGDRSDDGAKVAQAFSDAGLALEKAIDAARAKADSPGEVRLEDLAKDLNWSSRAKSHDQPCVWLVRKIKSFVDAGDAEELRVLLPAAERVALDVIEQPRKQKLRGKAQHDRDYLSDTDTPELQARDLLRYIQQYRRDSEPQWITLADSVVDRVKPLFRTLVGADARFLTWAERQQMYYSNSTKDDASKPWDVVPAASWMARVLPSSATFGLPGVGAPSGWSRAVGRVGGRGSMIVREPSPQPQVRAEVRGMR